jgi:predicted heme/steroid binding protein
LQRSELQLTPQQLKKYDGSDPTIPLYLAINGSIYDVSKGRNFYGPGGSYKWFSGVDASRAFVTTCFEEDRTSDLRGAELMYIPLDNPEVDDLYTSGELKVQKEKERRSAKLQVEKALKHWVDFFENSPKYPKVGTVKASKPTGPPPPLCKKAQDGRPKQRQLPKKLRQAV